MSNSNHYSDMQSSKEQRMLLSVALYSGVPLTEDEVEEHDDNDNVVDEKEHPSWSLGGLIVVSATLLTAFLVLLVGAAVSGKGCSMLSRSHKTSSQQRPMDIPYQLRGSSSTSSYEAEKNVPFDTMPLQKKKPCGKKAPKQPAEDTATEEQNTVTEILMKAQEGALKQFVQESKKVIEGKDSVEPAAEDAIATKEDVALPPIADMSMTKAKKPCDKKKKTPTEDLTIGSTIAGSSTTTTSSVTEMAQVVSSPAEEVEMVDVVEQVPEPKPATKKMGCGGKKAAAAAAAAAASEETTPDVVVTNKMMTTAKVETAVDPLWTRPAVVDNKKGEESKDDETKDSDSIEEESDDEVVDPLTDDGSLDSVGSAVAFDDDSWLIDNVDKEPMDLDESFDEEEEKEESFEELPMAEERLSVVEEADEEP